MRIAVAACLCFGTVSAQEQLRVRPAEVQQEDVVAALGALGVDVLRFDFSDFTRENYDVAVYLDEADTREPNGCIPCVQAVRGSS